MVRLERELRSQLDYILGTYHCLSRNLSAQDPRHNSDHYMVLGCLRSTPLMEHTEYLGRRTSIPLRAPTNLTREDRLFAALLMETPKPKATEERKNDWISEAKFRFIVERFSARRYPAQDQTILQSLGCTINTILKADRKKITEEAGGTIEKLLGEDPPFPQGSLSQDEGIVQGHGRPRAAARLGNT